MASRGALEPPKIVTVVMGALFGGIACALLLAGGLYLLSERLARSAARLPGVLAIPAFLFALNFAFLVASWRYATGSYSGSWRRTAR